MKFVHVFQDSWGVGGGRDIFVLKDNFRSESESVDTYSCRLFWLRSSQKWKDKTVVFFLFQFQSLTFQFVRNIWGTTGLVIVKKRAELYPTSFFRSFEKWKFLQKARQGSRTRIAGPLSIGGWWMRCRHRRITFEDICPILTGPSCELLLPRYLNKPESHQQSRCHFKAFVWKFFTEWKCCQLDSYQTKRTLSSVHVVVHQPPPPPPKTSWGCWR